MARLVSIFGIIFLTFAAQAQQTELTKIDSLARALASTKIDSTRFLILIELSTQYYNVDLKKSLEYGQDALDFAHLH